MKMEIQGSPKYYENRDPGPHFPMKMGTWGPRFAGSLFSHDTGSFEGILSHLVSVVPCSMLSFVCSTFFLFQDFFLSNL